MISAIEPSDLAKKAEELGLRISERSARRIMDGQVCALTPIFEIVQGQFIENIKKKTNSLVSKRHHGDRNAAPDSLTTRRSISKTDINFLKDKIKDAFTEIERKYYLRDTDINIKQRNGRIIIEYEMLEDDDIA